MRTLPVSMMLAFAALAQTEGDLEAIMERLGPLQTAVAAAYEDYLEEAPDAAGTITVSLTITRDGFAGGIEVSSDSSVAPVALGLEEVVSAIRFDPLEQGMGDIRITIPFELRPPEE